MKNKNVEVMLKSDKMNWNTPLNLFNKLNKMYGPFDLDAAAEHNSAKCNAYLTKEQDAFSVDWHQKNCIWKPYSIPNPSTFAGNKIFLNPEYGRSIGKWLKKAAEEAQKGATVVCLVPSRTGSKWFQTAVKEAAEVLFLKGRVVFETAPGVPVLDKKGNPMAAPFDSAVFVFKPEADYGFEGSWKTKITWWAWKE
jgi:phage N-6-adenine-methyltransferase